MADLAIKQAFPEELKTTFVDEERLKKLNKAFQEREFSDNVLNIPVAGNTTRKIGEEELIEMVVNKIRYQYEIPEKDIELPGIQMNMNLIKGFASMYKKDSGTPSDTIKPPVLASVDDIVFGFVTPQVWDNMGGTSGTYNYELTGLAEGAVFDIVDENGICNSGGDGVSLDLSGTDYWIFLTGDYIDLNSDSIVTEIQYRDVDDEDYGTSPVLFQERASDLHVLTASGHIAKSTLNIGSYAYKGGDHELVPIAFYMDSGPAADGHVTF